MCNEIMSKTISIITIVYNDPIGLERTLESITNQTINDFELIVIDGGSSDETHDILREYEQFTSHVTSEEDNGIYDAMNKGLKYSNGRWVIFMNAGDEFYSKNTLLLALSEMKNPDATYFGRAKIIGENNNSWIYPSKNITKTNINKWLKNKLPNHQAMFFPKCFYSINQYNLDFTIASDSDYKLRALKGKYVFLDYTVCKFYLGGLSSNYTLSNALRQFNDRLQRKSGQGGYFYAFNGLLRSIIKILLSKLFAKKTNDLLNKLKQLGRDW